MSVSTCDPANDTGTASTEYLVCHPDGAPFSIRMHRDAIDGIARDLLEQNQPQPAITAELGGLLLGRVVSGEVWIDRFQRIACGHEDGPRWVLNEEEREMLESSAAEILDAGEHSIVGFYRSHMRPDTPLQVDDSDLDLVHHYFADATDLVLLIRPTHAVEPKELDLEACFFTRTGLPNGDRGIEAVGPSFSFQGRGTSLSTAAEPGLANTPQPAVVSSPQPTPPENPVPEAKSDPDPEATRQTPPRPAVTHVVIPAEIKPNDPGTGGLRIDEEPAGRRWWPLFAAVAVVGLVAAFLLIPPGWPSGWPNLRRIAGEAATGVAAKVSGTASPAPTSEAIRPLGLSVNPDGAIWRVSWNSNATALNGARSVQLFVRESDDQNRIDLSPNDLASGTYQYHPSSNDVTFRLEVTEPSGTIAAESFRFRQTPAPTLAAAPSAQTAPATPAAARTAPRPIQRVAPVVGPGVRQRIPGIVPLDIRVTVDRKGRVLTAEPVTRAHDGLHKYLSDRAVAAAKQWRFEPARVNGQAADGEETIHFVFEKQAL